MRPFFNRPSWASRGEEPSSDFYRRGDQTYKDIIAASRDARKRLENGVDISTDSKLGPEQHVSRGSVPQTCHDQITCGERNLHECSSRPRNQVEPHQRQRTKSLVSEDSWSSSPSRSRVSGVRATNSRHTTECPKSEHEPSREPHHERGSAVPGENFPESRKDNAADDVVQILITSQIENTQPLIVYRRMTQPLRDVRLAWCHRHKFLEDTQPSIFLTWKGRRLFDVTTCRSLGIKPSSDTLFSHTSDSGEKSVHIHMEAVTSCPNSFNSRQFSPINERGLDQSVLNIEETSERDQNLSIRVVLKCPGHDEFTTRTPPKAPIFQIITAFRKANKIALEKEIYLVFDGDRLDPGSCLADYQITDDDLVDVMTK
ncbi:small ubiquitin-related modifier domain-containing protein [Aspergillus candidus]|uniref:Ubiquitin-like domain-containing protein n=1 Tax=Aspergillus candidus TaxID=41067 RepID=A0A2I2F6N8_ASPCN|nr:hypothetical protein BDW47DRAFT_108742 [Aspergillus candidus]PLB36302.1 hypothetical protein BDW47DRAFT_108742 [Aspergillus candidus]